MFYEKSIEKKELELVSKKGFTRLTNKPPPTAESIPHSLSQQPILKPTSYKNSN